MNLLIEEITILLEAMEKWENDDEGSMLGFVLGMALTPNEKRDEFVEEHEEKQIGINKRRNLRKEQSTMIKAKLLMLRDKVEAKELGELANS